QGVEQLAQVGHLVVAGTGHPGQRRVVVHRTGRRYQQRRTVVGPRPTHVAVDGARGYGPVLAATVRAAAREPDLHAVLQADPGALLDDGARGVGVPAAQERVGADVHGRRLREAYPPAGHIHIEHLQKVMRGAPGDRRVVDRLDPVAHVQVELV